MVINSDSKTIILLFVGKHDEQAATFFVRDGALRLKSRVQLTTDGLRAYVGVVGDAFNGDEQANASEPAGA